LFTTIPPIGDYMNFKDEEEYIQKIKEWGLLSASAKTPKYEFLYKHNNTTYTVSIKGYEANGAHETAIISFSNDSLHCIHPSYLKEMQSPSFGKDSVLKTAESESSGELPEAGPVQEIKELKPKPKKEAKQKSPKAAKIDLPAEKVSFEGVVKEFSTKYNHFNESEDEILILEKVKIIGEIPLEIGEAWCGYSNTLKKSELEIGDSITFDAKIVDRKLNKDIRYKINNPSKIKKQS
jgi:hypothetical protein